MSPSALSSSSTHILPQCFSIISDLPTLSTTHWMCFESVAIPTPEVSEGESLGMVPTCHRCSSQVQSQWDLCASNVHLQCTSHVCPNLQPDLGPVQTCARALETLTLESVSLFQASASPGPSSLSCCQLWSRLCHQYKLDTSNSLWLSRAFFTPFLFDS